MKKNMKKDIKEFINGFKKMGYDLKNKQTFKKQIPNLLTLSRIGIASFIPPLVLSGNLAMAAILTVAAALTDALDGFAARKLDAVSEFGKNLDPVCDKLFVGILIFPLMVKLPPLLTLGLTINLVLEALIASVNCISKAKGNIPQTTWLGKIKTALLSVLLVTLYLSFTKTFDPLFISTIYVLATTSQILTCTDYYRLDQNKDRLNKDKNCDNLVNDRPNNNDSKSLTLNDKVITSITQTHEINNQSIEELRKLKQELTGDSTELKEQCFQKIKK